MTICGYEDVSDLCCQKYLYQYAESISDGYIAITNSGLYAPVLRTDKDTGEIIFLNPYSTETISVCDTTDDSPIIGAWRCYEIWRDQCNNTLSAPPLSSYKDTQKAIINTSYNNALNSQFSTQIDGNDIFLNRKLEDQMVLTSRILTAVLQYQSDPSGVSPTITDSFGNILSIPYTGLLQLYSEYNCSNNAITNLKNKTIMNIDNAISTEDVSLSRWDPSALSCGGGCPSGYSPNANGICSYDIYEISFTVPPEAPTNLVASGITSSGIMLSFTPGVETGGTNILNYAYITGVSGIYGDYTYLDPAQYSSPVSITGLSSNITYSMNLRSINSIGISNIESTGIQVTTL